MTDAVVAKTARKPRAAKAIVEGEVAKVTKPRASRAKKAIVAAPLRKALIAPHIAAAAMLGVSATAIRYGAPRR